MNRPLSYHLLLLSIFLCFVGCRCSGPSQEEVSPEFHAENQEEVVFEDASEHQEAGCEDGRFRACQRDGQNKTGACQAGKQVCKHGMWGSCELLQKPTAEVCNGLDDDCDGKVDEDFDQDADGYLSSEHCQKLSALKLDCDDNNPQVHPKQKELCNGIDDNCDGEIDRTYILCKTKDGKLGFFKCGTCTEVAQEKRSYLVHGKKVTSLFSHKNKKILFSASEDGTVKSWNTKTWKLVSTLALGSLYATQVYVHSDGKYIILLQNNGRIVSWNLETKTLHLEYNHSTLNQTSSKKFAVNDKETVIASINANQTVTLWDIATGKQLFYDKYYQSELLDIAFRPSQDHFFTSYQSGSVIAWEAKQGGSRVDFMRGINSQEKHLGAIHCLQFSPDGKHILTLGSKTLKIWDVETKKNEKTTPYETLQVQGKTIVKKVLHASFHPTESYFSFLYEDGTFIFSSLQHKDLHHELKLESTAPPFFLFSQQHLTMFTIGSDNAIQVWDMSKTQATKEKKADLSTVFASLISPLGTWVVFSGRNGEIEVRNQQSWQKKRLFFHLKQVNHFDFTKDEKLFASGGDDKKIVLWDTNTFSRQKEFVGHQESIGLLHFLPSSQLLISADTKEDFWIWDVGSGKLLRQIPTNRMAVQRVASNKDGSKIALLLDNGQIELWESAGWKRMYSIPQLADKTTPLVFHPNGKYLFFLKNNGELQIWSVTEEKVIAKMAGFTTRLLAFSKNGDMLLRTVEKNRVEVWSLQEKTQQQKVMFQLTYRKTMLAHKKTIVSIQPPTSGGAFSTSGLDGLLKQWDIWNIKNSDSFIRLPGHTDRVVDIRFLGNGEKVLTISEDKTAKLWDWKADKLLHSFEKHTRALRSMALSSDDKILATSGDDHQIHLWDMGKQKHIDSLQKHHQSVTKVLFSPTSHILASGGRDRFVYVWDWQSKQLLKKMEFGHKTAVVNLAFSQDGTHLLSVGERSEAVLWDLKKNDFRSFTASVNYSSHALFSNDDQFFFLTDPFGGLGKWKRSSRKKVATYTLGKVSTTAFFLQKFTDVAHSLSEDGVLRIWSMPEMKMLDDIRLEGKLRSLRYSRSGRFFYALGEHGTVVKMNLK